MRLEQVFIHYPRKMETQDFSTRLNKCIFPKVAMCFSQGAFKENCIIFSYLRLFHSLLNYSGNNFENCSQNSCLGGERDGKYCFVKEIAIHVAQKGFSENATYCLQKLHSVFAQTLLREIYGDFLSEAIFSGLSLALG